MWFEPKEKTLHSGSGSAINGQIFDVSGKYGALRLQVTGITSATITFEQSNDGGTTWDGIAGINTETGVKATTATANGTFLLPVTGVKKFRARVSTYVTGTIYVYAIAVPAIVAPMEVYSSLLAGTALVGKVGIDQATANANEVVVKSITAGDANIGNVDIVTLPAGNLGQRAMAASLSTVPASDITDATYIGDIKFGEALPTGTNAIGGVTLTGSYLVQDAVIAQNGTDSTEVDLQKWKYISILMPAGWDAATLTIKGSAVAAGTKCTIKNDAGQTFPAMTVAVDTIYSIDANALMLAGVHFIALVASAAQTTAARTIKVMCKA